MFHQQAIKLGTLPLALILISTGQVGVAKGQDFRVTFDQPEEGLQAAFYQEDFVVDGQTFRYNTALPLEGKLKEYLKQQNMVSPFN